MAVYTHCCRAQPLRQLGFLVYYDAAVQRVCSPAPREKLRGNCADLSRLQAWKLAQMLYRTYWTHFWGRQSRRLSGPPYWQRQRWPTGGHLGFCIQYVINYICTEFHDFDLTICNEHEAENQSLDARDTYCSYLRRLFDFVASEVARLCHRRASTSRTWSCASDAPTSHDLRR